MLLPMLFDRRSDLVRDSEAPLCSSFSEVPWQYEKLAYYDRFVKSGTYAKSDVFSHFAKPFHELDGKVDGIIGMGAIGEKVAEIAETFDIGSCRRHTDQLYIFCLFQQFLIHGNFIYNDNIRIFNPLCIFCRLGCRVKKSKVVACAECPLRRCERVAVHAKKEKQRL